MNSHPIPESYWAEPDRLLAGPLPGAGDGAAQRVEIRALLENGIRTVIDLRTPVEPPGIRVLLEKLTPTGEEAVWMGIPILNGSAPSPAQMVTILDVIDASLARSRPVYVHCAGGRGRTGTVVACWWIRHGMFDPERALAELAARRAGQPQGAMPSPETAGQFRLVSSWLRGK